MLDIETLGPLVRLAPGATIEHTETWDLVSGVGSSVHQAEIDRVVVPKIPPKRLPARGGSRERLPLDKGG